MMGYKRLTIRNSDGSVSQPTHSTFEKVFNRLAEYEDDEESGKIVRLPCKVGDTVYKIMHVCGKRRVVGVIVSRISILPREVCIYFHKSKESWPEWCTKPHHFGENIFLTREEAEKRLLELQGETKL